MFRITIIFIALLSICGSVHAQASEERSEAAIAHYARARALLVEALQEFESGRRLARPDLLLDTEEWRISVISRTEELNKILDPQPRVTRSGVKVQANQRLIKGEGQSQLMPVVEVQSSNTVGERRRALELEMGRQKVAEEVEKQPEARAKVNVEGLDEILLESEEDIEARIFDELSAE